MRRATQKNEWQRKGCAVLVTKNKEERKKETTTAPSIVHTTSVTRNVFVNTTQNMREKREPRILRGRGKYRGIGAQEIKHEEKKQPESIFSERSIHSLSKTMKDFLRSREGDARSVKAKTKRAGSPSIIATSQEKSELFYALSATAESANSTRAVIFS